MSQTVTPDSRYVSDSTEAPIDADVGGGLAALDTVEEDDRTADAADVVPHIERVEQADSFHQGNLPLYPLPGFGEREDDCTDMIPRFCSCCGSDMRTPATCYRPDCPECAPWWVAKRRAQGAVKKLIAMRNYWNDVREETQFFHHVVVSPPQDWAPESEDELTRTIEVIKDMMAEDDLPGYYFYHPWRGSDDYDPTRQADLDAPDWLVSGEASERRALEDAAEGVESFDRGAEYVDSRGHDDDRGLWKQLLFGGIEWEHARDQLEFSPHFHLVVIGNRVMGGQTTKLIEQETGWVVDRITKQDSNVSIYDNHDVARVVTYCLSHVGIYEDSNGQTQAVANYFGEKSNQITASGASWDIDTEAQTCIAAVAPLTLGIPFKYLACTRELNHADHQDDDGGLGRVVDVDRAGPGGAIGTPAGRLSLGDDRRGELPSDGGGDLPSDDVETQVIGTTTDDVDGVERVADDADQDDSDDQEGGKCHGMLVPISKAPTYLEDDEWVAQAEHADELREAYEQARREYDWVD